MRPQTRDLSPRNPEMSLYGSRPSRSPIYPAAVYHCDSPEQAELRLSGKEPGYVYQRDKHPNAQLLGEKCRQLHQAEVAYVTSSGMAAISTATISCLAQGDHVLLSNRLYGQTCVLLEREFSRIGIEASQVDFLNEAEVESGIRTNTRMMIVETISNPTLRIADIAKLANIAHSAGARLLVDNTFASPAVCQPLLLGADLVIESMSKIMNGHGDLMLGCLCASQQCDPEIRDRLASVLAVWGFASSPMDCWLAERGLLSLFPRVATASQTALWLAEELLSAPQLKEVIYPGLPSHPDHDLAVAEFNAGVANPHGVADPHSAPQPMFGHMLTFRLRGGPENASRFIQSAREIPFCPSLGETMTTLSHPASTSHRSMTAEVRENLGIFPTTIRLSVGLESPDFILQAIRKGLVDLDF